MQGWFKGDYVEAGYRRSGGVPKRFGGRLYVAKIHGMLTSVSPMKRRTCSFFDGEITDGKSCMRLFGFDGADGVRRRLVELEEKKEAMVLTECEVKRLRQGNDLEIYAGKCTVVEKSEKSFDAKGLADMKFGKTVAGECCRQ